MTEETEFFEEMEPETSSDEETDSTPEESPGEPPAPEEPAPEEVFIPEEPEAPAPADTPVVIISGDIGSWEDDEGEIPYQEGSWDSGAVVILQEPPRPLLTTPFSDYTVTEGLLLLVLLYLLALSCVRMLKGGFPWLR